MNETNENKQNESTAEKAKAQLEALKTQEGRDALKGKLRRFWESGAKGKAICIGVPVLLLCLMLGSCGGGAGQAEIEFVKRSAFAGNDMMSIGTAIERNANAVKWTFGESDDGVKYVEVSGTLSEKGKANCIRMYGSGFDHWSDSPFLKAIPEVYKIVWKCSGTQYANYFGGMFGKKDFLDAVARFENGEDIVVPRKDAINPDMAVDLKSSDPGFRSAAEALKKAREEEADSKVRFKAQFPMPVANYNAKGKFDPERAVCRQGYSSIAFTKGPLAGIDIQTDLLAILH